MAGFLALLFAAAALLAPAPTGAPASGQGDDGGIGIALVDAPVARAEDPRAHRSIIDHLRPGDSIERHVRIENTTATPMTVEVYVAGAEVRDGQWAPAEGRTANELSSWVSVGPPTVELAPGTSTTATVAVAVPETAASGERYAVIWAQAPPATANGVTVLNRVGVRIYLSVGAEEPATDFLVLPGEAATGADGTRLVCATVENTGGRAIELTGGVTLTDRSGTPSGSWRVLGTPVVAPGERIVVCAATPASSDPGPWTATVTLTSGTVERTATFAVTFPPPDPSLHPPAPQPVDGLGADEGSEVATTTQLPSSTPPESWSLGEVLAAVLAAALISAVGSAVARARRRS